MACRRSDAVNSRGNMRAIEGKAPSRRLHELPDEMQHACAALVKGLRGALGEDLYAVYLYGAAVFRESEGIFDLDFHVIVRRTLDADDRERILALYREIGDEFPTFDGEFDGYYVLLEDAREATPPRHQLDTTMRDESWALHRAHWLAGYCIVLHGPQPRDLVSAPTWPEILASLEAETRYVVAHLEAYPAYGVLNLCRLVYSHTTRDVVVSKRAAAEWAIARFPCWEPLVRAALRTYRQEATEEDALLLASAAEAFHRFCCARMGRKD